MAAGGTGGSAAGERDSGWIKFLAEAREWVSVSDRLGDGWQLRTFEASKQSS